MEVVLIEKEEIRSSFKGLDKELLFPDTRIPTHFSRIILITHAEVDCAGAGVK